METYIPWKNTSRERASSMTRRPGEPFGIFKDATIISVVPPDHRERFRTDSSWLEILFKELLLALKCHGFVIFKHTRKTRTRDGRLQKILDAFHPGIVLLALSTSYAIHYAVSSFIGFVNNPNGMLSLFSDLVYLFRMAVAVITAIHMTSNSAQLCDILKDSAGIFKGGLSGHHTRIIRKYVVSTGIFAFANLVVFLGVKLIELKISGFEGYYRSNLYNTLPSFRNGFFYALPVLDIIVCSVITTMPKWTMAFHISVCKYLSCLALELSRTYEQAAEQTFHVTLKHARRLREYHWMLCELIFRFNEIYNFVLFVWYADIVANFVLSVPWIIIQIDNSAPWMYACVIVDVTFNISLLVVFNVAASDPGRLVRETLRFVLQISSKVDPEDVRLNQEILLLASAVKMANVEMSGWNCFDVERGVTITVVSMLATYAVLVFQMLHRAA